MFILCTGPVALVLLASDCKQAGLGRNPATDEEPLLLEVAKGHSLKLGDTHPYTLESWYNLIELYEAWNKPKEAEKWRAKLPQTEAVEE